MRSRPRQRGSCWCNLQPRLAPTVDQLLDVLGGPPLFQQTACDGGKVRPHLEQVPHGFFRSLSFPELAVGGSQHHMRAQCGRAD